jgi:hypothetical protein
VALSLLGLMLLVLAAVAAAAQYTTPPRWVEWPLFAFGVMAVMTGLGMALLGTLGRRFGGFLAAGLSLTVLAVPFGAIADNQPLASEEAAVEPAFYVGGVSSDYIRPMTPEEAAGGVSYDAGDLTVDLTAPEIMSAGDLTVDVELGAGRTVLILPPDTPVVVKARVSMGRISTANLPSDLWTVTTTGGGVRYDDDYDDDYDDYDYDDYDGSADEPSSRYYLGDTAGLGVSATVKSKVEASDGRPTLTVNFRCSAGDLEIHPS